MGEIVIPMPSAADLGNWLTQWVQEFAATIVCPGGFDFYRLFYIFLIILYSVLDLSQATKILFFYLYKRFSEGSKILPKHESTSLYGLCWLTDLDLGTMQMGLSRVIRQAEVARFQFLTSTSLFKAAKKLHSSFLPTEQSIKVYKPIAFLTVYRIETSIGGWSDNSIFLQQRVIRCSDAYFCVHVVTKIFLPGDVKMEKLFEVLKSMKKKQKETEAKKKQSGEKTEPEKKEKPQSSKRSKEADEKRKSSLTRVEVEKMVQGMEMDANAFRTKTMQRCQTPKCTKCTASSVNCELDGCPTPAKKGKDGKNDLSRNCDSDECPTPGMGDGDTSAKVVMVNTNNTNNVNTATAANPSPRQKRLTRNRKRPPSTTESSSFESPSHTSRRKNWGGHTTTLVGSDADEESVASVTAPTHAPTHASMHSHAHALAHMHPHVDAHAPLGFVYFDAKGGRVYNEEDRLEAVMTQTPPPLIISAADMTFFEASEGDMT